MKTVAGVVLLAGACLGVYALNGVARTEDGKSVLHVAAPLPITVELAKAELRPIVRSVQAPGDVEAFAEVDIRSEVVAKILEMPIKEGDKVSKGDLLCRLDDADYRARVTQAEANVAKLKATIIQAQADLEKTDRDYQRQIRLSEADATSSLELADYRTMLVRTRAGVEIRQQELVEAQARWQSAKEDLEKTVITAPIDGVISQLFAKQGEVVVTGTMNNPGTRIMVVSDLSKMQVRCRVDETDAPLVEPGQSARIYLQSDSQQSIAGHVARICAKGTKPPGREVVTFETLVLVDSDDRRVKPGMTASVEVEVARKAEALTVPVQAVVHRKRKDLPEELVKRLDERPRVATTEEAQRAAEYVKIIFAAKDEIARPRLVTTGIADATRVEIVDGLAPDEIVVTGPFRSLDQLKDGSKVKTEAPKGGSKDAGPTPSEESPAVAKGKE